jgi:hypothetical protein
MSKRANQQAVAMPLQRQEEEKKKKQSVALSHTVTGRKEKNENI